MVIPAGNPLLVVKPEFGDIGSRNIVAPDGPLAVTATSDAGISWSEGVPAGLLEPGSVSVAVSRPDGVRVNVPGMPLATPFTTPEMNGTVVPLGANAQVQLDTGQFGAYSCQAVPAGRSVPGNPR